ncbi:MAG: hypothetical protein LC667_18330 [Thioalkalivibrio sp.]|nr:hypothetical protein [Thioalkalivibrio sp.]
MKRTHSSNIGTFLMVALTLGLPRGADAQLTFMNALGYGSTGLATGALLTAGAECTGFLCVPSETVVASRWAN